MVSKQEICARKLCKKIAKTSCETFHRKPILLNFLNFSITFFTRLKIEVMHYLIMKLEIFECFVFLQIKNNDLKLSVLSKKKVNILQKRVGFYYLYTIRVMRVDYQASITCIPKTIRVKLYVNVNTVMSCFCCFAILNLERLVASLF